MRTRHRITTVAVATIMTSLLGACGGGSDAPAETNATTTAAATPASEPAPTPATPAPKPATPAPTPVACTAAAIGNTGYSLVFKGCDAANVATYYDKTECVRDNVSGHIWEGKPTTGLRQSNSSYTNYDNLTKLQVPIAIPNPTNTYIAPLATEINSASNTVGYAAAVNSISLCGYSNWRLPTKTELLSIVDASTAPTGPTVDATWFPNTQANGYWTSDAFLTEHTAVGVYFNLGLETNFLRAYSARVRLVR